MGALTEGQRANIVAGMSLVGKMDTHIDNMFGRFGHLANCGVMMDEESIKNIKMHLSKVEDKLHAKMLQHVDAIEATLK